VQLEARSSTGEVAGRELSARVGLQIERLSGRKSGQATVEMERGQVGRQSGVGEGVAREWLACASSSSSSSRAGAGSPRTAAD